MTSDTSQRLPSDYQRDLLSNQRAVIHALKEAGVNVDRISMLSKPLNEAAVTVLLRFLGHDEDSTYTQQDIVRALAFRGAPDRVRTCLLDLFECPPNGARGDFTWTVGAALEIIGIAGIEGQVQSLAADRSKGFGRERLVRTLGRIKSQEADDIILQCLDESGPGMLQAAIYSAKRKKLQRARPKLNALAAHEDRAVRDAARAALRALDDAQSRGQERSGSAQDLAQICE